MVIKQTAVELPGQLTAVMLFQSLGSASHVSEDAPFNASVV